MNEYDQPTPKHGCHIKSMFIQKAICWKWHMRRMSNCKRNTSQWAIFSMESFALPAHDNIKSTLGMDCLLKKGLEFCAHTGCLLRMFYAQCWAEPYHNPDWKNTCFVFINMFSTNMLLHWNFQHMFSANGWLCQKFWWVQNKLMMAMYHLVYRWSLYWCRMIDNSELQFLECEIEWTSWVEPQYSKFSFI